MKRTSFAYVVAAALLATPVVGVAQEATPRGEAARQWGSVSFVDRLVQHQSELGLSQQQVTQLRSIGESLQAANAPYLAQLQQARAAQGGERSSARGERGRELTPEQREQLRQRWESMTPEQREALRQQREARRGAAERSGKREGAARGERQVPAELQAAMQQVRQNNQQARQQALAVLTPAQQERARELVRSGARGGERPQTGSRSRGR